MRWALALFLAVRARFAFASRFRRPINLRPINRRVTPEFKFPNNGATPATDPMAGELPLPRWRRAEGGATAAAVFLLTVFLTVGSFPPYDLPELAYLFALPAALWAYRRPPFRLFALATLGAQAVAWTIILGWLHNVTWMGLFLLGPVIGIWIGSWFLAARWLLPRLPGRSMPVRILAVFGLAGLWAAIEWTRTWFLGGFPWLPLAASQWHRASILQIAAYAGAGAVSFILVGMNLGVAAYAHRLFFERREGLARRSPEFIVALLLLLACLMVYIREATDRGRYEVPLARVGFVQPDIPQSEKWDHDQDGAIFTILQNLTLEAASAKPTLILWPEASTPWALNSDHNLQTAMEDLVKRVGAPMVLGSVAFETQTAPNGSQTEQGFNAAFAIDPAMGVQPGFYAKRKLVPFGEYVPLRWLFGWLKKFVPIGDDFSRGARADPLFVRIDGQPIAVGTLICYEDIFPSLARASSKAGADVLVVVTNNGWFGEGGAASQHAANSVLRAVETRRPVLRDGNAGWSGWIDEFGSIRAVVLRDAAGQVTTSPEAAGGTIYFRGTATADVTRDSRWIGRESFYTIHGDWFVCLAGALALLGWLVVHREGPEIPIRENWPQRVAKDAIK
jgi:apolipoprotein N-acyltransferase